MTIDFLQQEQDDLHNTIGILGMPGLGDYREKLKRRIQSLKAIRTIIEREGEDEK